MKGQIIFALIALIGISSCVTQGTKQNQTQSTQDLVSFFKTYKNQEYKVGNDIQKEELYAEREKALQHYVDSVAILTNLQGKISDISLSDSESGKSKILTYEISVKPEEYFELTFECANIISIDSLKNDYLYNKIKAISNYSTVYFDGIISIDAKTNLPRSEAYGIDLAFSYPKYKFHVVDLSTIQLDTLSSQLRMSVVKGRKAIRYMFKDYRKESDYNKATFNTLSDDFNLSKTKLNDSEIKYIQRYMNAIVLDI